MTDDAPADHAGTAIDERLRAAGAEFRSRPIPDVALRWPAAGKGRSRLLVPLAVAAGVAAVIAGISVAVSTRNSSAPASPSLQPDRYFAVGTPAPPPEGGTGGPGWLNPACKTSSLRGAATTTRSAEGIIGVVELTGPDCSIQFDSGKRKLQLLGPTGSVLAVGHSTGNQVSAPGWWMDYNGSGPARYGFAWTGSYCGPAPTHLQVFVSGHVVVVPWRGPSLPCTHRDASTLTEGIPEGVSVGVVPAPVSWESLHARVVLPSTLPVGPVPLTVEITNSGTKEVSLAAPCASYGTSLSVDVAGSDSMGESVGDLCDRPYSVKPGQVLTLHLGTLSDPNISKAKTGDRVTITWTMTGVQPPPSATATFQ